MRRENKNQKFHGQVQTALNESELLHQPIKSIFDNFISKAILGAVALVAGLLFFPFSMRSIIAETSVLVLMIWFSSNVIKSRKGATILRFWLIVLTMLLFGAACPFIVFPKPMYIAVLESDNLTKANVRSLDSSGNAIGSALLVSDLDYIRQGIAVLLRKIAPVNFRILEKTKLANGNYYNLPIFEGLIFNLSEPGEFPALKSIYFPVDAVSSDVSLNLAKPEMLSSKIELEKNLLRFGSSITLVLFIDFAYDQYPETTPWEAVQVQQGQEVQVLSYAALLDRSLEFFAAGKSEEGLKGLEAAANFIPPENMEGARLALLKYEFVALSFKGNVGELQSLPLLHKAYDMFIRARTDPRFSEKDPLTKWLRQSLWGDYSAWDWSSAFLDRESFLNSIPHIDDDRRSYTYFLRNEFEGRSYDDLLAILRSKSHSPAELNFLRHLVWKKFGTELIGNFVMTRTNYASECTFVAQCSEAAKKAHSVIQLIDSSLSMKGELQVSPRLNEFIEFFANEYPKFWNITNQIEAQEYFLHGAMARLTHVNFTNSVIAGMIGQATNAFPEVMNSQWWKPEYLSWFSCWSVNAVHEIDKHDHPWKAAEPFNFPEVSVRKLVSKYGNSYLTKDMGGKGRTFLPGLFFLTWYSQTFGLDDADKLKQQFEAEAKLSFDSYLSKLSANRNLYQ